MSADGQMYPHWLFPRRNPNLSSSHDATLFLARGGARARPPPPNIGTSLNSESEIFKLKLITGRNTRGRPTRRSSARAIIIYFLVQRKFESRAINLDSTGPNRLARCTRSTVSYYLNSLKMEMEPGYCHRSSRISLLYNVQLRRITEAFKNRDCFPNVYSLYWYKY